jgi:hypothetical protein
MDVVYYFNRIKTQIEEQYAYTKNCFPVVMDASAIVNDFNRKYVPPKTKTDYAIFEKFCFQIFTMQANPYAHQLTCGVDSEHACLVPRITTGGVCVLVCPTCGYVQDTMWFFDQKA